MASFASCLSSSVGSQLFSNATALQPLRKNLPITFSRKLPFLAGRSSGESLSSHFRPRRNCGFVRRAAASSSPLSSSLVEEEEGLEDEEEGSAEGMSGEGEVPKGDMMEEVMRRLAEEDLEEAAKKYDYENRLFAQIDFAQINVFTNKPFSGNPAAVCYLPYERDDEWLQLVAREFNLTATAFVVKRRQSKKGKTSEGDDSPDLEKDEVVNGSKPAITPIENEFDVRWFTSTTELDICGHGTLASAHMLFSSGLVEGDTDTIIFHSKKGVLKARKIAGYDNKQVVDEEDPEALRSSKVELGKGVVELEFPMIVASQVDGQEAQLVSDALGGIETVWVGSTSIGDYLVELPSKKHLEELQPKFEKMLNFSRRGGLIATALASEDSKFDFVSRFFAPKMGILEDSVTGSSHCTLAPYWSSKIGKDTLQAYQASQRGGELAVRVDSGAGIVYLQGGAVLVMAGSLLNTFPTSS